MRHNIPIKLLTVFGFALAVAVSLFASAQDAPITVTLRITDTDGVPIPDALITDLVTGESYHVDPTTGSWTSVANEDLVFVGVRVSFEVSAPGHQTTQVDFQVSTRNALTIRLERE